MSRLDAEGWRGVFTHKNELGTKMGIALLVFTSLLWESRKNRMMHVFFLFLGVALLVLSSSMTSTIVVALTLSIGWYVKLRLRPVQKVALGATVLLVVFAAGVFLQGRMDSVFALVGRNATLTGRIPLWQFSAGAVLQRPLLGAGWDAFWFSREADNIRNQINWAAPHAHNGFIEVALNIGLIGMVLFLILNFDCFRQALRYSKDTSRPFRLWPLLFYTYNFLSNFTEAPPVDRHTLTIILFCALSVSMTEASRMEALEHEQEQMEYMHSGIVSDSGMFQEPS
jgi:O-antigen ligase